MQIAITILGTRGDVQPYVAIGKGLAAAGHDVLLATHPMFEDFVRKHGLDFGPIRVNPRIPLEQDVSQISSKPLKFIGWFKEQYDKQMHLFVEDALNLLRNADAILYAPLASTSYHIAEYYQLPSLMLSLQPVTPTRSFPAPTASTPSWMWPWGLTNWLSFKISNQMIYNISIQAVNIIRVEQLKLRPNTRREYWRLDTSDVPIIYGYSPAFLPKPADWDKHKRVTGYWFLETGQDWQPPAELLAFLEAGPPPVYFGFGSMIDLDAKEVTQIVVSALEQARQRGILLGGWGGIGEGDLPDTICQIDSAPHGWLFPRMAAVVHHGGAGTTAAGLKAGKPSVVIPFFADQPWWGRIIARRGVGPDPIPRKNLTAEKLAGAIDQAVTDRDFREQAAILSKQIQGENGVAEAVRLIEHYLNL